MRKQNPDTAQPSWQCETKILTRLGPAGHAKQNPDTAPEPGQDHTKSHEITLQVHFTASTVLRKIQTLLLAGFCEKNIQTRLS
jgi:hypothetical protein